MRNFFLIAVATLCTSLFVACDKENPKNLDKEIKTFISDKYPNATIMEVDQEYTYIEVDIMQDGVKKELTFEKKTNNWISTHWDISIASLPEKVTESITTNYPTLRLDDVEYYQTPQGDYYLIDLEPGDLKIKVKEDGTILK